MARKRKEVTENTIKSDWSVDADIQGQLLSHLSGEFETAARNNDQVNKDFETYYNMIHAIRESKQNEWESDIYMPEFLSRLLTQIGNFVAQYFGSTDFVENDIDSEDPKDILEAKASKALLNTILNDKESYYYQKIVRLIMFVFNCGYGIIKGGYEQRVEPVVSHYSQESSFEQDPLTGEYLAEDGMPFSDPTTQRPKTVTTQRPVYKNDVLVDRPVFDVYPNQNVYMSPEYVYSLNDKEYIIFETEKSLDKLKAEKDEFEYFNLELLEKEEPEGTRGEKTYNKDGEYEEQSRPVLKNFIILERWGKYPCVTDENGKYIPGIDKDGNIIENAKNEECIIYIAKNREGDIPRHIIGFRRSPHSRRPMVRFLCYVDMIKDNGFGDGEVNSELQKAVNDNYNLMNYRTRLSITPAFKAKKFSGIPEKIRISPENVTFMENLNDLQEIDIKGDINGGILHHNLLTSRMDYSMATAPQTMGMSPERAETATVGSIINQRANVRIGMKSMNLEFIGFTEFYDMLLTLCNDFMLPETLEEILGEKAFHYNPRRKDKFKPVSQALETEESKQFNIRSLQSVLGMVAPIQNPKTPMMVNMLVGEIMEAMGKKFKIYKKFMLDDNPANVALYQALTGAKGTGSPPASNPIAPTQNQSGLPQSNTETQMRNAAPNQPM